MADKESREALVGNQPANKIVIASAGIRRFIVLLLRTIGFLERIALTSDSVLTIVMPGLVPGIHVFRAATKSWMAGTSPRLSGSLEV